MEVGMSIKFDKWIWCMVEEYKMIELFVFD